MELRNSPPSLARAPLPERLSPGAAVACCEPETVEIERLHPTQFTVGYREVAEKRRRWRDASPARRQAALGRRKVPVIVGPDGVLYALDRHHWLCALEAEGVEAAPIEISADLRHLDIVTFWLELESRGWCHPYDSEGIRRDSRDIPASIAGLQDDPFRSLASALRRAGGFDKDTTLFSEFQWADFLRRQISQACVAENFAAATEKALQLCRDRMAVS
ncbi:ParB-like protein [Sphingopyxis chilensis]